MASVLPLQKILQQLMPMLRQNGLRMKLHALDRQCLVVHAARIMHGKTSAIRHTGKGVFRDLADSFEATRYHSLVIDKQTLPECLEVTAWTENEDGSIEEIMGVRHKTLAVEGVQFHPESILTQHGHALLKNFLDR